MDALDTIDLNTPQRKNQRTTAKVQRMLDDKPER